MAATLDYVISGTSEVLSVATLRGHGRAGRQLKVTDTRFVNKYNIFILKVLKALAKSVTAFSRWRRAGTPSRISELSLNKTVGPP